MLHSHLSEAPLLVRACLLSLHLPVLHFLRLSISQFLIFFSLNSIYPLVQVSDEPDHPWHVHHHDNEKKEETEDGQHNEREEEEKEGEDAANPNDEPEKRGGQYSKNPKGSVVAKPTTISFYPELWHKLLDLARARMHLHVAVEDAFPKLEIAVGRKCREVLDKVIAHFETNQWEVERGMSLVLCRRYLTN